MWKQQRKTEYREILEKISRITTNFFVIKGPALAVYYKKDQNKRDYADLDLIFPDVDTYQKIAHLFCKFHYKPCRTSTYWPRRKGEHGLTVFWGPSQNHPLYEHRLGIEIEIHIGHFPINQGNAIDWRYLSKFDSMKPLFRGGPRVLSPSGEMGIWFINQVLKDVVLDAKHLQDFSRLMKAGSSLRAVKEFARLVPKATIKNLLTHLEARDEHGFADMIFTLRSILDKKNNSVIKMLLHWLRAKSDDLVLQKRTWWLSSLLESKPLLWVMEALECPLYMVDANIKVSSFFYKKTVFFDKKKYFLTLTDYEYLHGLKER